MESSGSRSISTSEAPASWMACSRSASRLSSHGTAAMYRTPEASSSSTLRSSSSGSSPEAHRAVSRPLLNACSSNPAMIEPTNSTWTLVTISPSRLSFRVDRSDRSRMKVPLPLLRSSQPSSTSSLSALRTVTRLTLYVAHSSISVLSSDPGGYSKDLIRARISFLICR